MEIHEAPQTPPVKPPRYTDLHRYPYGWTKSADTDISETFWRVRERQKAESERERLNSVERLQKVINVKRGSK